MTQYLIDSHRIIRSPGKFERQRDYAPWAWEITMDGTCDIIDWPDGTIVHLVALTDDDRAQWGLDTTVAYLACAESDQGFVTVAEWTEADCERMTADSAAAWEDESQTGRYNCLYSPRR